jgi:hypothetical protein
MPNYFGVAKTSFNIHSSHVGITSDPWSILDKEIKYNLNMIRDDVSECKHQKKLLDAKSFMSYINIHKVVYTNYITLAILFKIMCAYKPLYPNGSCLYSYFLLTYIFLLTTTIIVSIIITLSMSFDSRNL